jgi:hypothetical protein
VSQKYPGGIISKTAPVTVGPVDGEGGSAPGIWTLTQALELQKQNLWPKPVLPKELYVWGYNGFGQQGQSNTTNRSSPTQVASDDWAQIGSGGNFNLVVKNNGTLWSWGYNGTGNATFGGQLGLNNTDNRSSPVQVGSLTTWYEAAPGGNFSLVTKTDGTLWSWGRNADGQLGLGDANNRSSPVQVGALTTWAQISGAFNFIAAIKTDGTLWSWGRNNNGELGLNDTVNRSSPVQVGALTTWAKVAGGTNFCLAIKTDGTLWSWGIGSGGPLGLNDTVTRSSPVQVGLLTNWRNVSAGNFSAAVKTDGTLWTWGPNSGVTGSPLGHNDSVNRSSPVQVGALTTWSQVATARNQCFAIKTDKTLWSWGYNGNGALGLGDVVNRSSPVQIGALSTWVKLPKMSQTTAWGAALKTP